MTTAVAAVLVQLAMLALAVLLAVASMIGAVVALKPAALERMRRAGQRRREARLSERLNRPYNLDRWFYRRHRLYGAVVGALALVLLGYLTFGDASYRWLSVVEPRYRGVASMFIDAGRILLWLFGIFALVIATVVFVRPSALKGIEAKVNRWTSLGRSAGLEREFRGPDQWAVRYPRAWGVTVALVSLSCLLALLLHAGSLARMGM
jgi:hypothetical protein